MKKNFIILLVFTSTLALAQLKGKGKYEKGVKAGIWEFYNQGDTLEYKINFSSGEILSFTADKEAKEIEIKTGEAWQKLKVDRVPVYSGGELNFYSRLYKGIVMPPKAVKNKVSGKIVASFVVETNGTCSNHEIVKGLEKECDLEAIRLLKSVSNNWLPAVFEGKAVAGKYVVDIFFNAAK